MTNMEMLLNKLKRAKLRTPKPDYFEQYLYDIDDRFHWKNKKKDAIVNEFYAAKYELWHERLIKRIFYVEQRWLNKEKQYCNIYEVQRFLAGSNKKLNRWIYSASFGGVRPQYWKLYENCEWEENNVDRMVCSEFSNYSRQINFYSMNSYKFFLKNSIQKYNGFEYSGLGEERLFWYLYQYEKHPQMEIISKMGLFEHVQGNLSCLRWSKRGIKILGIENRNELEFLKLCKHFGGLRFYRKHKENIFKYNLNSENKISIYKILYDRKYEGMCKKLIDYISSNQKHHNDFRYYTSVSDYLDYIGFCNNLGIPLTSSVKYPQNLKAEHDRLQNQVKINESKHTTEMIQKHVINKLFKYRYADNNYVITPANSVNDLIDESMELSHCVRTYSDRYAKGQTSIFLIRERNHVNKPFYTLELKEGKIKQVRGKHNCDPTDEVKKFVCSWAKKFKIDPYIYQNF